MRDEERTFWMASGETVPAGGRPRFGRPGPGPVISTQAEPGELGPGPPQADVHRRGRSAPQIRPPARGRPPSSPARSAPRAAGRQVLQAATKASRYRRDNAHARRIIALTPAARGERMQTTAHRPRHHGAIRVLRAPPSKDGNGRGLALDRLVRHTLVAIRVTGQVRAPTHGPQTRHRPPRRRYVSHQILGPAAEPRMNGCSEPAATHGKPAVMRPCE